jgi:hypothetical protein
VLGTTVEFWPGDAEYGKRVGDEKTIALLPDQLRPRVVGTTIGTPPRFGEIKIGTAKTMTVIRHAAKYGRTKWLALDDDAWGVPSDYEQHFLHTDSGNGTRRTASAPTVARVAGIIRAFPAVELSE